MMETVDPDNLPPGTLVDSFRVVRRLDGGAYGTVYLVEERGVLYALKMARFREHSGDKRHTHERAQRELACLLSLHHLYIARVWGHGRWPHRTEGYFYVVMEYVEGGTLAQWREDNRATAHEVLELFDKVLEAVAFMHGQGIFHRDLKPGNILVRKGGKEPVVVDYGVAHFPVPAAAQLTDTVLPPGTPRYTSPEALRFEAQNRRNRAARYEFTVADELYALGVTLFDLLTDPQPSSHPQPVPLGIGLVPTPLAHEVNERVPVPLSYFVAKLLAPEPGKRPVSAEAARRDLAELLQLQSEEWTKRPLHPPPQLPPEAGAPAPVPVEAVAVPVEPVPVEPARVEAAGAGMALSAASAHAGVPRRWPRAVAAGTVAVSALLACGVYLVLSTGETAQPTPPAPVAAEAPRSSSRTPSENAAPPMAPPAPTPLANPPLPSPSPAPPVPTPEKGTPVNIRRAPEAAVPPQCAKKPPPRGTPQWWQWCKCVGASTLVAVQAGCTGVPVRQSPTAECSKEAVQAMELLNVAFGHSVIDVQLDLAFPPSGERGCGDPEPCIRLGPRTSVVAKGSGKLVRGTLLAGQVFRNAVQEAKPVEERWQVFRWTEATLPNGDKYPVCISAGYGTGKCPDGFKGQTCAVLSADIVERWREPITP